MRVYLTILLGLLASAGVAQAAIPGLDDATNLVDDIFSWATGFVIATASVYFLWVLLQVYLERKTWQDVLVALVWACIAGGGALIAKWAVGYFT